MNAELAKKVVLPVYGEEYSLERSIGKNFCWYSPCCNARKDEPLADVDQVIEHIACQRNNERYQQQHAE